MAKIGLKTTPPDLLKRLKRYPKETKRVLKKTGEASLLILHEKVPPYPDPFPDQRYRRTGHLGRSLGTAMGGQPVGKADVEEVRQLRSTGLEVRFGTNLHYAPDVIGQKQKPMFEGRWWKFSSIARRSRYKITKAYEIATNQLVKFLDGKG